MESVFATLNEAFPSGGDAFETLKQTADLSPRVVNHLKNVYGFLAVLLASATVGAYLAVTRVFALAGAWHFLGSLAVMFGFGWAKTEDQKKALGMLLAFMQGNGLGPVLSMAGFVGGDRLIFLALGATAMIFIGFTGATLLSGRDASASRWKLYTLGTLGSMAMVYPYLLLFNLFFGFGTTYAIELYLGLAMFCLYIVGDTQVIVAKAESGHYDVVGDALNLFTDLAQVFVRILVILSKKESEKERRERERRRRH